MLSPPNPALIPLGDLVAATRDRQQIIVHGAEQGPQLAQHEAVSRHAAGLQPGSLAIPATEQPDGLALRWIDAQTGKHVLIRKIQIGFAHHQRVAAKHHIDGLSVLLCKQQRNKRNGRLQHDLTSVCDPTCPSYPSR